MGKGILDMGDDEVDDLNFEDPMEEETEGEENEVSQDEVEENEDTEQETEEFTSQPYTEESSEEGQDSVEEVDEPPESAGEIDYKAAYEQLTAPFKANGRSLKVDNVDEAIRLMQMGANYNKKMTALKPSLQILKMLERNDLLDESKLSFLIDVDKKNPKAIAKLLKESEIDPMDLDTDSSEGYQPGHYRVSDSEMAMDEVLDELETSPHFSKTADIISKQWDSKSRSEVLNNPQLLKVLHSHVESGIYDQVSQVMDKERTLGNLSGVPDIVAYKQIGDSLHSKGLLKTQSPASRSSKANMQNMKANREEKRKQRKKAAMPTKRSASSSDSANFNPLALSDDEFEKISSLNYM